MLIGGLQKTTLLDFPDRVASLVFTVGCNFRCPFCHNPELVDPELIKNLDVIKEEDFFKFLGERKSFIDGVCITGGEPTIHSDLVDFIKKIKNIGFAVKLDTNGTNPEVLEKLIEYDLPDYVAMDIKAPFDKYEKVVGIRVDIEQIKKSVNLVMKNLDDYEFRTTVVPGFLEKEDILDLANDIKGAKKFYLQQFVNKGKMLREECKEIKPYSSLELKEIREKIKHHFNICEIRGI